MSYPSGIVGPDDPGLTDANHAIYSFFKDTGVTIIHDAHRTYYHCAYPHFATGRDIGEILWIGTQAGQECLNGLLT